jgi:hypothetical protein
VVCVVALAMKVVVFFVTPRDTPVEARPTAQYRLISDPGTTERQDSREEFAAE